MWVCWKFFGFFQLIPVAFAPLITKLNFAFFGSSNKKTHQLDSALWIPVTASQDNGEESVVVAVMQIGILFQKFAEFFEGRLADFRCFPQLFFGNRQQLRRLIADVNIKSVRHNHTRKAENFAFESHCSKIALRLKSYQSSLSHYILKRAKSKGFVSYSAITDNLLSCRTHTESVSCCPMSRYLLWRTHRPELDESVNSDR